MDLILMRSPGIGKISNRWLLRETAPPIPPNRGLRACFRAPARERAQLSRLAQRHLRDPGDGPLLRLASLHHAT